MIQVFGSRKDVVDDEVFVVVLGVLEIYVHANCVGQMTIMLLTKIRGLMGIAVDVVVSVNDKAVGEQLHQLIRDRCFAYISLKR